MQFDFDSALMGYGAGPKFTSAGDAVVPTLTPRVSGYSQYPFSMQTSSSGFDKTAYDLPLKPLYDITGNILQNTASTTSIPTYPFSLHAVPLESAGDGGGSSASLGRKSALASLF